MLQTDFDRSYPKNEKPKLKTLLKATLLFKNLSNLSTEVLKNNFFRKWYQKMVIKLSFCYTAWAFMMHNFNKEMPARALCRVHTFFIKKKSQKFGVKCRAFIMKNLINHSLNQLGWP